MQTPINAHVPPRGGAVDKMPWPSNTLNQVLRFGIGLVSVVRSLEDGVADPGRG